MATKQVKMCDVFESAKRVSSYEIIVRKLSCEGDQLALVDKDVVADERLEVDLCPRAKKRFDKFLTTATTPPGKSSSSQASEASQSSETTKRDDAKKKEDKKKSGKKK